LVAADFRGNGGGEFLESSWQQYAGIVRMSKAGSMRTTEIIPEQWPLFFDDFTEHHQGKRVNVETLGSGGLGVTSHVHELPLVGIMAADPEAGTGEWIEIIAGDSARTYSTHSVPNPAHVRLAEEDDGRAMAIQIESAHGLVTIIRVEQENEAAPMRLTVG
jgi:hypothetical protein